MDDTSTSEEKDIIIKELEEGISIITDKDLNDKNDKKTNFYYHLFSSLEFPNPSKNNWKIWKANLTKDTSNQLKSDQKICFINLQLNYATRSSSLIAIPDIKKNKEKIVFKSIPDNVSGISNVLSKTLIKSVEIFKKSFPASIFAILELILFCKQILYSSNNKPSSSNNFIASSRKYDP